MIFKDAFPELKKGYRIWNIGWNKTGFIFKDIFFGEVYNLALLTQLVEFTSNPQFKGVDERLYSIAGQFRLDENPSCDDVINTVRKLITEYFNKTYFCLATMGYEIKIRGFKDEWEVLNR